VSPKVDQPLADIRAKLHEAEFYQAQGLLEASLDIYDQLISENMFSDSQLKQDIENKIGSLRQNLQIQELEQDKVEDDLSVIHGDRTADETFETLLENAATLKELGLVKEAANKYEKAFIQDPFDSALITHLMDCLFQFLSPDKVFDQLFSRIRQINLEKPDHDRLLFSIALEFKKRGQNDSAIKLYHVDLEDETVETLMDSAAALEELEFIKEAADTYGKAFIQDPFDSALMAHLMDCLFQFLEPSEVIEHLYRRIRLQDFENTEKAKLLSSIALEFEKREQKELALELYKTSFELDSDNAEINRRLTSLLDQLTPGSRYDYLLNQKLINSDQLKRAKDHSQKNRKSLEMVLIEDFNIQKADIGKSLSLYYNCRFKSFDPNHPVPVELIRNLKKTFLLNDVWVPLSWEKKTGVEILVDDPKDIQKTDHIKALIKLPYILSVGIAEDIKQYIKLFYDQPSAGSSDSSLVEDVSTLFASDLVFDEESVEEEPEGLHETDSQVVRLVDTVLVTAYRQKVSDIHIEPSPVSNFTTIRFRMDGVCQEFTKVPNAMARGILSRIKIMCNLDISERRLPQDGKIKFRRKGVPEFELRVATIPTTGGYEDAVMRILAKAGAMKLDKMGLNERNMRLMQKILIQPYGLILVVGPTGSGKTTTLHAALGHINKPGVKIWTAEDPVEITQAGLRQVEVKPRIGLDFARVMRSFLRADPDVIMIGEMRDEETASIGVEASLTGHLVFSTLHTNSAPETITRLLDMKLNPLNFSDAFLGVLAQRLVRTLCSQCREPYHPSEEEFNDMVMAYGDEAFKTTGRRYTPEMKLNRAKMGGCDACSGSGYKGRIGIHELMEGTREIKRMIKKQASAEDLFIQAAREGMATLKQDAIDKVFQGLIDMKEVNRVCIG